MSPSICRGEIGATDDIQTPGDGGARNGDAHYRYAANEVERTRPEVGATIPDGATRQLPTTGGPSCIA